MYMHRVYMHMGISIKHSIMLSGLLTAVWGAWHEPQRLAPDWFATSKSMAALGQDATYVVRDLPAETSNVRR